MRPLRRHRRAPPRQQRGQAMVEYALLVFWLSFVLFLPVFPVPGTNQNASIVMLFVKVFDIYINSFHAVIVLPVP